MTILYLVKKVKILLKSIKNWLFLIIPFYSKSENHEKMLKYLDFSLNLKMCYFYIRKQVLNIRIFLLKIKKSIYKFWNMGYFKIIPKVLQNIQYINYNILYDNKAYYNIILYLCLSLIHSTGHILWSDFLQIS